MKLEITVCIILALAGYVFREYQKAYGADRKRAPDVSSLGAESPPASAVASASRFRCDGRTHCSQMTSCDEAFYFLQNCPGVKMDGGSDGVPCKRQWCGNR
ncbi:MAG: excalibur calcium-binding domain-containing protein [Steroidobacteraceae bacterium]|nr:excalibur calcium-binding domain-containing protein [Steroidobacteraceae bacterium]